MGFMDKMKAANGMNLGHIESPDFPCGVIVPKGGTPTIINGAMGGSKFEVPITKSNVRVFKLIGCGGTFAKYYLELKDGRSGVITQPVSAGQPQQGGTRATMAPIERFIRITDDQASAQSAAPAPQRQDVCPQCGSPIDGDMLFCGECGRKLK